MGSSRSINLRSELFSSDLIAQRQAGAIAAFLGDRGFNSLGEIARVLDGKDNPIEYMQGWHQIGKTRAEMIYDVLCELGYANHEPGAWRNPDAPDPRVDLRADGSDEQTDSGEGDADPRGAYADLFDGEKASIRGDGDGARSTDDPAQRLVRLLEELWSQFQDIRELLGADVEELQQMSEDEWESVGTKVTTRIFQIAESGQDGAFAELANLSERERVIWRAWLEIFPRLIWGRMKPSGDTVDLTVRMSPSTLADALGLESGDHLIAQAERRLAESEAHVCGYPVGDWALMDRSGRIKYFRVPIEARLRDTTE